MMDVIQANAERLAELKIQIKVLEEEAKKVEASLIAAYADDKLKTQYGTLTKTTRVAVDCIDKDGLFKELGPSQYILASTVNFGTIKKQFGEVRAEMLKSVGYFQDGKVSVYYSLRK